MPALAMLLVGPGKIDGEDAIKVARRFLARIGVRGTGGIQALGRGWRGEGTWSVALAYPEKRTFFVQLTDRGVVYDASAIRPRRSPNAKRLDVKTTNAKLRAILDRIPDVPPTRPERPPESFYPSRAFLVLRNGLVFFNMNPTYAYRVDIDEDGGFASFSASEPLPPVPSPLPRVSESEAHTRLVAKWGKKEHDGPFPQHIVPQLGYYLVKGETVARLVWRGWTYSDRNPLSDGASSIKGFLDANTGALIPPNPGQ